MLIGELAGTLGVQSQTIRFYERRGLLPEPTRGANGYRIYGEQTLALLTFIRAAQATGLSLAEIRDVIALRGSGEVPCTHVANLINSKLTGVRAHIRDLAVLEAELTGLLDRSQRLDPADCTAAEICHILAAAG